MASLDAKDSLDVLQDMYDDALIKTAKALRELRLRAEDPNRPQVRYDVPGTVQTFQSALDDVENEILRAKSVMERDLARLHASKTLSAQPAPVEAQSKPPHVIDLGSSPAEDNAHVPKDAIAGHGTESKPVAPFPDMGPDASAPVPSDQGSGAISETPQAATQGDAKAEGQTSIPAPPAPADQGTANSKANDAGPGEGQATTTEPPNAELTFTDMEFTLAPPAEGSDQGGGLGTQDQSFDLTNFAPTDMGNDSISLENLLPQAPAEQTNGGPPPAPDTATENQGQANDESAFDGLNMDTMDFGAADGTDFDFSMGDGNSFDDLMNSHEQNFDTTMEHGQFDAEFFGLKKTE